MGANKGKPTIYIQSMSNNQAQWLAKKYGELETALKAMGTSIMKQAQITAPKENNYLVNSGQVKTDKNGVVITFGNSKVPYASYQERGERYDGSHVVENYTFPNTGKEFLKNAGNNVTQKGLKRWLRSAS